LIENDPAVTALALATVVENVGVGEVAYTVDANARRQHGRFVLDVVAENSIRRYYAPNAVITSVGEQTFPNDGSPAGFPVTIAADFSGEISGHYRVWERTISTSGSDFVPQAAPFDTPDALAAATLEAAVEAAVQEAEAEVPVVVLPAPEFTPAGFPPFEVVETVEAETLPTVVRGRSRERVPA
jgi:hypothetical protein